MFATWKPVHAGTCYDVPVLVRLITGATPTRALHAVAVAAFALMTENGGMSDAVWTLLTALIGGLVGGGFAIAAPMVQAAITRRHRDQARSTEAAAAALASAVEAHTLVMNEGVETTNGCFTREAQLSIDRKLSDLGVHVLCISDARLRELARQALAATSWTEPLTQELGDRVHPFAVHIRALDYLIDLVAAYIRGDSPPELPEEFARWEAIKKRWSLEGRGTWIIYDTKEERQAMREALARPSALASSAES